MKKNICVLLIVAIAFLKPSNAQLLVGKIENGNLVLTKDKSTLLIAFNNNLLKASAIDGKFTEVYIQSNSENNYFLVFKGDKYRSTFLAQINEGYIYIHAPGTSCTTSECASELNGCIPILTACSPCKNKGKCTKTVSDFSLLE